MERKFTLNYLPECAKKQTYGYLLAFTAIQFPDPDNEEFTKYTTTINVCTTKIFEPGKYIQCVLYGSNKIPFSIVVPYSDELYQFLGENRRKRFDIVLTDQPKPFGKDMYRGKID